MSGLVYSRLAPFSDVSAEEETAARELLESTPGLGLVLIGDQSQPPKGALYYPTFRPAASIMERELPAWQWVRLFGGKLEEWGYVIRWASGEEWDPLGHASWKTKLRQFAKRPLTTRVDRSTRRWRRLKFIWRIKWLAWLAGATVNLQLDKDITIEPGIRLEIRKGNHTFVMQRRTKLQSGVIIRLGGDLFIGRRSEMRFDVALNVKGSLVFEGRNNLARGTMVHADADMFWGWGACSSEYVTVLDSHHEYDGSLVHVHDQAIDAQSITIGATTLLGAKSTVMPGVTIGRTCMIGSSSVVTKDVPDGMIAVGIPAKAIRAVVAEPTHG